MANAQSPFYTPTSQTCGGSVAAPYASGRPETAWARERAVAWMEQHARVMQFWLDRLVETGDPDGLVDTLHRQCAWLDLMLEHHRNTAGEGSATA